MSPSWQHLFTQVHCIRWACFSNTCPWSASKQAASVQPTRPFSCGSVWWGWYGFEGNGSWNWRSMSRIACTSCTCHRRTSCSCTLAIDSLSLWWPLYLIVCLATRPMGSGSLGSSIAFFLWDYQLQAVNRTVIDRFVLVLICDFYQLLVNSIMQSILTSPI